MITLNDGNRLPPLGLGLCGLSPGSETREAVVAALDMGYRLFDTASAYQNEADVRAALDASDVARDDVFITSKLWNNEHGRARALDAVDRSRERLGVECIDLYLIHFPLRYLRLETWAGLVEAKERGWVQSIGVSNYLQHHVDELMLKSPVVPAINQMEMHPFLYEQRRKLVMSCRSRGIAVQAHSPLTRGRRLDDRGLQGIAARLGLTTSQLILAWSVQQGFVPIPRTADPVKMRANLAAAGTVIPEPVMREIERLHDGYQIVALDHELLH